MKTRLSILTAITAIALSLGFVFCTDKTETNTTATEGGVKWLTYNQAVALSKKNPKPIFIDVYTDWCGWCKTMDKNTFSHPKVAEYLNKNFYSVKLNAEKADSVLYKGVKMTNPELSGRIFRVSSYPTTVYLEANETLLQPIPGYMEPNQFNKVIHFIGDGAYKTSTWDEFQATFKETI